MPPYRSCQQPPQRHMAALVVLLACPLLRPPLALMGDGHPNSHACNGCKRRLICRGMYRPRRVGRGTTSFPSDAWSALSVCAWCAGYSASDGSRSDARATIHRWSNLNLN